MPVPGSAPYRPREMLSSCNNVSYGYSSCFLCKCLNTYWAICACKIYLAVRLFTPRDLVGSGGVIFFGGGRGHCPLCPTTVSFRKFWESHVSSTGLHFDQHLFCACSNIWSTHLHLDLQFCRISTFAWTFFLQYISLNKVFIFLVMIYVLEEGAHKRTCCGRESWLRRRCQSRQRPREQLVRVERVFADFELRPACRIVGRFEPPPRRMSNQRNTPEYL